MPTPYGSRYSGGGGGSSSGGTISDITSTGGTITVTNPTGPTTNIETATNIATVRNTSSLPATTIANESTILTGSTASGTLTLVNTPVTNSSSSVTNSSSVSVTIHAGASDTIQHYATSSLSSILIPAGMSIVMVYELSTNTWHVISGGFVPGYLLGSIAFRDATDTTAYTVTGTSMAAIDTSKLRLAAVIGPNGNAKWRASAAAAVLSSSVGTYLGLMHGATVLSTGFYTSILQAICTQREDDLTGLTPGAGNYDLAAYTSNAADALVFYSGPTFGPIEFSLTAA